MIYSFFFRIYTINLEKQINQKCRFYDEKNIFATFFFRAFIVITHIQHLMLYKCCINVASMLYKCCKNAVFCDLFLEKICEYEYFFTSFNNLKLNKKRVK